jgi:hypothetical protein
MRHGQPGGTPVSIMPCEVDPQPSWGFTLLRLPADVHLSGALGALHRVQAGSRWDSPARIRSARDPIPSLVKTLRR